MWFGLEVEYHPEWTHRSEKNRYRPRPSAIYGKGYYSKWRHRWVFYPKPFCYLVRLCMCIWELLTQAGGEK